MLSKIFDSLDVQAFCAVKWEKAVASLYAFPWGYTYNSESNGEQYLGGGFGVFIYRASCLDLTPTGVIVLGGVVAVVCV